MFGDLREDSYQYLGVFNRKRCERKNLANFELVPKKTHKKLVKLMNVIDHKLAIITNHCESHIS